VAIDAVAAQLMGFDPMSIAFIRKAHELGLGCGDVKEIEIVGDEDAAAERWNFTGPFAKMTFASAMQHKIYWGPLKKPIEWSLKTVLAPWAYLASVAYHDSFWYPFKAKAMVAKVMDSDWGKLFANWELVTPDERGFEHVGDEPAQLQRSGFKVFLESLRLLWMCLLESPEVTARRRTRELRASRASLGSGS
jgi:hypothetical protein